MTATTEIAMRGAARCLNTGARVLILVRLSGTLIVYLDIEPKKRTQNDDQDRYQDRLDIAGQQ
jgi:hypothetical protein